MLSFVCKAAAMRYLFFLALFLTGLAPVNKTHAELLSPPEKFIRIHVDTRGYAYVGKDTLTVIELTDELRIRLWKSYLGTGKMPKAVLVSYIAGAAEWQQAATEKALKEGLQKALQQLCVHRFKKKYEAISKGQQQKLKKQFPVLFQQVFAAAGD